MNEKRAGEQSENSFGSIKSELHVWLNLNAVIYFHCFCCSFVLVLFYFLRAIKQLFSSFAPPSESRVL